MRTGVQLVCSHLRLQHVCCQARRCTVARLPQTLPPSFVSHTFQLNEREVHANRAQGDSSELSLDEQMVVQVFARSLGVSVEQFVDLACECPEILNMSPTALRSVVARLTALLGKPQEDIVTWMLSSPTTILQHRPEDIDTIIADISDATGMYYNQVVDVVLALPQVLDVPAPRLASQISTIAMIARASREDALQMVDQRPELLTADTMQLKAWLAGGRKSA
jgi:hypothetical protein